MAFSLSAEQARVLGALIEKENTTPDYYPLTLNGLLNACNQKSNRDPVMNLDDHTTLKAIDGLRDCRLAWMIQSVDARVPKYEHNFDRELSMTLQESAVMCVLLLRGPQTIGELRGRTARIYPFENLDEVMITIQTLMDREKPLVAKLPLQPGRKEARYAHLMCGDIDLEALAEQVAVPAAAHVGAIDPDTARQLEEEVVLLRDEVAGLQEELAGLHEEVDGLRKAFDTFKGQFE